jgi:1-acyl-sn-glycerol-3-phosphate acyltransferase
MEDGDRPGGRDGGGRSQPATPLRLYRGGRSQRPGGRPEPSDDVADRLTALERVVEDALARGEPLPVERERALLAASLDQALATVAWIRRGTLAEMAASLGLPADDASPAVELLLRGLARWWWRVETRGIDRLPAEGPVVVIANRASAPLPFDALIAARALRDAHPAHRRVHVLLDDEGPRLPVVGSVLARLGVTRSRSAAARKLLAAGEVVLLFPEDEAVASRPFADRYRLARFEGAFARLAIDAGAPIVPVAVVGAAETQPVLARLPLGLPVTPTFPWLGLPGLIGLPAKWTLDVGEPLAPGPAPDPTARRRAVAGLRTGARERLQALVLDALRRRESILLG